MLNSKNKLNGLETAIIVIVAISLFGCGNLTIQNVNGQAALDHNFSQLLRKCRVKSVHFDSCMKDTFNQLRPFFRTGVPDYHILPFDPHRASFVELRRGNQNGLGGFHIVLRNVSEYGWTRSKVTAFHTDFDQKRIVYSQYFPEKSLHGWYEFSGRLLGTQIKRSGFWNLTLYDYSQTTSVRRLGKPGSPLKVRIEVDHVGGLRMHLDNVILPGQRGLDNVSDLVINSSWRIALPFITPFINELVSTAFTDIFNHSFRYFPLDKFLNYS